jgi:hypothetical protein
MFDRNLNGELDKPSNNKRVLSETEKIIETIISKTHMVYKQSNNIKSLSFVELS